MPVHVDQSRGTSGGVQVGRLFLKVERQIDKELAYR